MNELSRVAASGPCPAQGVRQDGRSAYAATRSFILDILVIIKQLDPVSISAILICQLGRRLPDGPLEPEEVEPWVFERPDEGFTTAVPLELGLNPVAGVFGVVPPFSIYALPCHFG